MVEGSRSMEPQTLATSGNSAPATPDIGQRAVPARVAYVDNLRTLLIGLVVLGHVAVTYGSTGGPAAWYYIEQGEASSILAIVLTVLLGIGWSFLLGLFFLIAGLFTPRPYDRKGPGLFIADRLLRLGVPLVFYAVVINPLVTYWAEVHRGFEGSLWAFVTTRTDELTTASVGPLWFVEALLIFSLVYALARILRSRLGSASSQRPATTRGPGSVPRNRSVALFALALGLLTFVVRIWAKVGWNWEPPHLELAHFPQYVVLFAVGIAAYRGGWLERMSDAQAKPWRWIALLLVPLMLLLAVAAGVLSGDLDPAGAGGLTWLSLAYSMWEAFMCVAMVITVLAWARKRLTRQGRLARAVSRDSFAVYVLHPLILVPLTLALSSLRLDLGLKFLLVAPLALLLCFGVAHFFRMLPFVRRIL
jgi:glucan biosynthesis protein C